MVQGMAKDSRPHTNNPMRALSSSTGKTGFTRHDAQILSLWSNRLERSLWQFKPLMSLAKNFNWLSSSISRTAMISVFSFQALSSHCFGKTYSKPNPPVCGAQEPQPAAGEGEVPIPSSKLSSYLDWELPFALCSLNQDLENEEIAYWWLPRKINGTEAPLTKVFVLLGTEEYH